MQHTYAAIVSKPQKREQLLPTRAGAPVQLCAPSPLPFASQSTVHESSTRVVNDYGQAVYIGCHVPLVSFGSQVLVPNNGGYGDGVARLRTQATNAALIDDLPTTASARLREGFADGLTRPYRGPWSRPV